MKRPEIFWRWRS